jgi:hypothetical protein
MNARELATVLAALRHWQADIERSPSDSPTERARALMPDFFADREPLDGRQIDALCEGLNFGDAGDLDNPGNVDWKLLRMQKMTLLRAIADAGSRLGAAGKADLEGILHLIDTIQDQAAKRLGERTVFGRR